LIIILFRHTDLTKKIVWQITLGFAIERPAAPLSGQKKRHRIKSVSLSFGILGNVELESRVCLRDLLFLFDMNGVFTQAWAKLLQFQFFAARFLAECVVVVAGFLAHEMNDFQFLF
jgi:hypothetical protein